MRRECLSPRYKTRIEGVLRVKVYQAGSKVERAWRIRRDDPDAYVKKV